MNNFTKALASTGLILSLGVFTPPAKAFVLGGGGNNVRVTESDRRRYCEEKENGVYLGDNKCQNAMGAITINSDQYVSSWIRGGRRSPSWGN